MNSAKPFFFSPPEVILFVENILLSVSFARSRSLSKLKSNTQTVALCTLIELNAGGLRAVDAPGFAFAHARNLVSLYPIPRLLPARVRFPPAWPWMNLGWSWMGNNERNWIRVDGDDGFLLGNFCRYPITRRACHEIIRTHIFPCIIMRIRTLWCCLGRCKFNDVSLRSAFDFALSRASLRLHNLLRLKLRFYIRQHLFGYVYVTKRIEFLYRIIFYSKLIHHFLYGEWDLERLNLSLGFGVTKKCALYKRLSFWNFLLDGRDKYLLMRNITIVYNQPDGALILSKLFWYSGQ